MLGSGAIGIAQGLGGGAIGFGGTIRPGASAHGGMHVTAISRLTVGPTPTAGSTPTSSIHVYLRDQA